MGGGGEGRGGGGGKRAMGMKGVANSYSKLIIKTLIYNQVAHNCAPSSLSLFPSKEVRLFTHMSPLQSNEIFFKPIFITHTKSYMNVNKKLKDKIIFLCPFKVHSLLHYNHGVVIFWHLIFFPSGKKDEHQIPNSTGNSWV